MIDLVDVNDIKSGRGSGKSGEYYTKYKKALTGNGLLDWLKDQISTAKDGTIWIKNADIKKELGPDFVKKDPTSIYWGLKYVLFHEGIIVGTATHNDGSEVLTMRLKLESDTLPESLAKKDIKTDIASITTGATEE